MIQVIFFVGMLAVFWFFIVLPQRRRRQRATQVTQELEDGDEVITAGGIFGVVREVGERHVVLEIAPETRVRLAKSAVTARVEAEPESTETAETSLP